MADDIDDLLDEVESKFCDSKQKRQKASNGKAQNRPKSKSKTGGPSSSKYSVKFSHVCLFSTV